MSEGNKVIVFEELLTVKQLAGKLGRHRNYVTAMRKCGFPMPGGLATVTEARSWLARNPAPRSRIEFRARV